MTPKEKAKELVNKMQIDVDIIYVMSIDQAKQCALNAIDEILNYIEHMNIEFNLNLSSSDWQEVKQEIEKL